MGARLLARVVATERLGAMVRLTLHVSGWTGAEPGQFALLQAEPSRCFLARAVSVSEQEEEKVSFLIAPIGDGTRELCALEPGRVVWVTGPLGTGFAVDVLADDPGRTVVVGGGVGVAPFPLLLDRLAATVGARSGTGGGAGAEHPAFEPTGLEVLVLAGFRDDRQSLGGEPLREAVARAIQAGLRCSLEVVCEDGSHGPAERVSELLERRLRPGDRVAVCGPEPMSAAVWRLCGRTSGVRAWFSLESGMACGVGSCHGCVLRMADGSYARVCHDGPVFAGEAVFGA